MSDDKNRDGYQDNTKRPIVKQNYLHGTKTVSIEDLRIARGSPKLHYDRCKHRQLVFSPQERAIWCDECETRLDPFDVFILLVEKQSWVENRFKELQRLEDQTLISRAAREFDVEFRKRSSVPCCPNCKQGIFPEDVNKGLQSINKEQAQQIRQFKSAQSTKNRKG